VIPAVHRRNARGHFLAISRHESLRFEIDHFPPLVVAISAMTTCIGAALLWWQLKDRTADISLDATAQ
jgi:hypothetical protein